MLVKSKGTSREPGFSMQPGYPNVLSMPNSKRPACRDAFLGPMACSRCDTRTSTDRGSVAVTDERDDRLLRLYRAWYDLAETGVYIALFRSPHQDDQNSATSWENFVFFLPTPERWPDVIV